MNLFGEDTSESDVPDNDNEKYSRLGRYAEFLVCADITKHGFYASHIDATGFDILLVANQRSFRVQVKSSSTIREGIAAWECRSHANGERGNLSRKRNVDIRDADILALYHHTLGCLVYMPVSGGVGKVNLPVSQLKSVDTLQTLVHAVELASA